MSGVALHYFVKVKKYPSSQFLTKHSSTHFPYELSPGLPKSFALNFIIVLVPKKQQKCVIFFVDM